MSTLLISDTTGIAATLASFSSPERVELAVRRSEAVSVTLSWFPGTDIVAVTVDDESTGHRFELVADGAQALDVFDHPFAYASSRGLTLLGESPAARESSSSETGSAVAG